MTNQGKAGSARTKELDDQNDKAKTNKADGLSGLSLLGLVAPPIPRRRGPLTVLSSLDHMLNTLLTRIVGTKNERELKKIRPIVAQIGAFEPQLKKLSD